MLNRPGESTSFPRTETDIGWVIWATYGAFYFCRSNISAAVPGIEEELALSKTQIGLILGSLKFTYGIGQFINGQLAERISPRRLLAIGMLGSAGLNFLFGFGVGLYFLLFVWACNGYCQSLGWTPCMRVAANWFPAAGRGRAIGIIGTGYQATAAATYVIAGSAVEWFGWRGAFYVPAILLAAASVFMLLFMKESPPPAEASTEGGEGADLQAHADPERIAPSATFSENVLRTVTNPALWALAVSLGLLNACRYGFLDWGISHLHEVQGTGVGRAALKYAVLPIGGIAGSLVAGWATDRFFGGRRAPVIFGLLVCLGLLTILYDAVVRSGLGISIVVLLFIGFTVYGPQVLLVGTAPIDLARGGVPAAAVGFVNFVGYMGAFTGDQLTGFLVDNYDWQHAVYFWALCAFGAAGAVAFLWRATPTKLTRA